MGKVPGFSIRKMVDIHAHMGYSYILDSDGEGGFLELARIGFLVKN